MTMVSDRGRHPPRESRAQSSEDRSRHQQDVAAVLSGDASKIDEIADQLGQKLVAAGLNTSQIRNFYGPIAIVRAKSDPEQRKRALRMHRSRLAYLVARARGGGANELWNLFGDLLKRAEGKEIEPVCDLAEAVVAYHRYYLERRGSSSREEA
jgi:CRISPR type III-A-associated protein Csm2